MLAGWLALTNTGLWMIVWLAWWSTAKDLRDLGQAFGVKRLRHMHPALQGLAAGPGIVLFGLPTLIVLFRAPRQVREAQVAVGLDRPVPRHIAWLVLLWPVLCVVLQRELNRMWQAQASGSASETRPADLAVEA